MGASPVRDRVHRGILVNLNPAYRTHELAYALDHSGTRLLVSARSFKTSDYVAMVDEVRTS